jgi:hypothetical protein
LFANRIAQKLFQPETISQILSDNISDS